MTSCYPKLINLNNSQMNYDGLLAQLTDDKLVLFDSVAGNNGVEEGAILEEQAATIQTIPLTKQQNAYSAAAAAASAVSAVSVTDALNTGNTTLSNRSASATLPATTSSTVLQNAAVTMTPQRKISTSSRFMNAFTQLYSNATNTSTTEPIEQEYADVNSASASASGSVSAAVSRTPTKGMESKLMSMWHNVKYGWSGKIRANFSKEQPVWLLGRCYHRKASPQQSMENSTIISNATTPTSGGSSTPAAAATELDNSYFNANGVAPFQTPHLTYVPNTSSLYPQINYIEEIIVPQECGMDAAENQNPWEEGIEGFKRDFYSRIWMTYRREFPTMNGSNYTSDCGWGCMLRSGQMLLAQALIFHFLGRSWRYDPELQMTSTYEDNTHRKIIKWFGDSSSKSSPFSIHALVHLGQAMGKKPGDWYGPSSVSHLLRRALQNASQENADFDNITIYVARDCTIYMQDIEDLCRIPEPKPKANVPWQAVRQQQQTPTKSQDKQHWKSLILLVPLRLGTEKLNTVYAHCLKLLLSTEYCIGIIGGRPKHSLYFVGFQEDRLIHLDPHYCQEMVDVNQENFPLHSFHCKSPRKLKTSKMDPSCCIGFYCATKTDFDNFMESVQPYLHPMRCASGTIDRILPASMQLPNAAMQENNGTSHNQNTEMTYPLFSFSRGRCMEHERDEMSDSLYKPLQKQLAELMDSASAMTTNAQRRHNTDDDFDDDGETEEFVLL